MPKVTDYELHVILDFILACRSKLIPHNEIYEKIRQDKSMKMPDLQRNTYNNWLKILYNRTREQVDTQTIHTLPVDFKAYQQSLEDSWSDLERMKRSGALDPESIIQVMRLQKELRKDLMLSQLDTSFVLKRINEITELVARSKQLGQTIEVNKEQPKTVQWQLTDKSNNNTTSS